ncbi:acyl-CoA dehydrogenase family protein [Nocardia bovistercoris]|uniref:Acyl-CoA dehydrogenase family protein n=1 Tax=Nocardia bovistercoris TaxID=2785916 RepID=A0A931N2Q7_9NOCA|nr:acyl-CoA dehydrogenase family protein [Nocardia bovistercoris]MBH0779765.1 acyl-CoA dehydrogenase family protein [Nocardia bovistercoris]
MSDTANALDRDELRLLETTARKVFESTDGLAEFGELGLLGLLTSEANGGDGWRVVEASSIARECGRALSRAPWIAATVAAAASDDSAAIGGLLAGRSTVALAGANASGGQRVAVGSAEPDVLLVSSGSGLAVVPDASGLGTAEVSDGLDTTRDLILVEVGSPEATSDSGLRAALVLLLCADSAGALAGSVELLTEYLVGRDAFGQPLAGFQVIAHRLADLAVLVEAANALIDSAAAALAARRPHAEKLVELVHAYLARRSVAALDDCIQLAGGIGFTWEWRLHHAMRRVLVNASLHPVDTDAAALLGALTAPADADADSAAFRRRVRQVIAEHRPYEAREGHRAPESAEQERALRDWYRTLYADGLLGASWPPERGGRADWEPRQDLILTEELIRARAPRPIDQVGLATHVLLEFGTEEQKRRHLPAIREARDIWCQLFSEPGAGSDLAGITARATRREDGSWVLAGQKTWTTDGHWAQYGLALLRTSNETKRHDGITAFIVPMDSPGLEVRPKPTIGGADEFNDVFLDGVVLAPEQVVGAVGRGWAVAMSGLNLERFTVGANVVLLELLLADVVTLAEQVTVDAAPLLERADVAAGITDLVSRFAAAKCFLDAHVARALSGAEGEAEAPIAKILYSETYNSIARFGVELATAHQPVPESAVAAARRLQDAWLWSRALTISGGSSEVMRNIIAKRRLRLPSGR